MKDGLTAVLRSLRFVDPQTEDLGAIDSQEWHKLLRLTDRSQLTLPLGVRCREHLPGWVQARIDRNLADNATRHRRIAETYDKVSSELARQEIQFMVLKGFSNYPGYCSNLHYRPQYDLDLYCPPDHIERAYAAVLALGYEPFGRTGRSALDHLPPLILKTGWRPKDDYFDPDIPVTIELHFRFWDPATEGFNVSGTGRFWERREMRQCGPLVFPTLSPVDAFSYASWHLVRHLLRGDARAYHVYELAHFLHHAEEDDTFWRTWKETRPSPIVEAIACRLAVEWFGCRMNPAMQRLLSSLPAQIEQWFRMFGFSPLVSLQRPNKDELFLHLSLVNGFENRLRIARRRLFPKRLNPYIADVHVPSPDWRLRLKRRVVATAFLAKRALHHARTWAPLIANGLRWRRALATLPPPQDGRTLHVETAPR